MNKRIASLFLALALLIWGCGGALALEQAAPPEAGDAPSEAGGTPPEFAEGETPPEPPEGAPDGTPPGGGPGGGTSSAPEQYAAVTAYEEDAEVDGASFSSTGKDENALHILGGATVTLKDIQLTRSSSDSTGGDSSSFYGIGAGLLATDGTGYLKGGQLSTDAAGGAGAFAYGSGALYLADTVISTEQDTSGGIHASGGGQVYAWDLSVETQGASSAAIRSDRGGGTMVVDGGSYTARGLGSPAIYCTADITAHGALLAATGSEAVCIEGRNSIRLFDCQVSGAMQDLSQNDCTWTVIVYQSMSGDAEVGNSVYQMVGGSLTSENGGLFYTTNTECDILLSGVDIVTAPDCEFFLRCTGNQNERGWGQVGANGAQCTFTADAQEMVGDVVWDSVSQLDFYALNGSTLAGAWVNDERCAGASGQGYANLTIDASSTWTVTGNSALSQLNCAGRIVDDQGLSVSIVGRDGTQYAVGESAYTITVDGYQDSADTSGACALPQWSDFEVEKPAQLA